MLYVLKKIMSNGESFIYISRNLTKWKMILKDNAIKFMSKFQSLLFRYEIFNND